MAQDQDQNEQKRDQSNLDEEMERDTEIRRETQVRGSLGLPPSGEESEAREQDEGVPEFEDDSEDRKSDR